MTSSFDSLWILWVSMWTSTCICIYTYIFTCVCVCVCVLLIERAWQTREIIQTCLTLHSPEASYVQCGITLSVFWAQQRQYITGPQTWLHYSLSHSAEIYWVPYPMTATRSRSGLSKVKWGAVGRGAVTVPSQQPNPRLIPDSFLF